MRHRSGERAERLAHRAIPCQRQRAHRVTVIRAVERDEARSAGKLARDFQRALDRLSPAVGEIHALERRREQLDEPPRQLHLALDHILAVHHDVQMASRLRCDRVEHFGISVAERGHSDTRDEIEITASVRRDQPRALGAQYFQAERRVGSLRQVLAEEIPQLAHRRLTIRSRNAPPPWRQSSGGDCISPGAHTYGIPSVASVARISAASDSSPATATASIRPATLSTRSRNSARLRTAVTCTVLKPGETLNESLSAPSDSKTTVHSSARPSKSSTGSPAIARQRARSLTARTWAASLKGMRAGGIDLPRLSSAANIRTASADAAPSAGATTNTWWSERQPSCSNNATSLASDPASASICDGTIALLAITAPLTRLPNPITLGR